MVADASEEIDGIPLFVKLVDQGRIVHRESFSAQADRADQTWGAYDEVVLSQKVAEWKETYAAKRAEEIDAARARLTGGKTKKRRKKAASVKK